MPTRFPSLPAARFYWSEILDPSPAVVVEVVPAETPGEEETIPCNTAVKLSPKQGSMEHLTDYKTHAQATCDSGQCRVASADYDLLALHLHPIDSCVRDHPN